MWRQAGELQMASYSGTVIWVHVPCTSRLVCVKGIQQRPCATGVRLVKSVHCCSKGMKAGGSCGSCMQWWWRTLIMVNSDGFTDPETKHWQESEAGVSWLVILGPQLHNQSSKCLKGLSIKSVYSKYKYFFTVHKYYFQIYALYLSCFFLTTFCFYSLHF